METLFVTICNSYCETCSKLAIKSPERRQSGVLVSNFEHISHIVLVFPMLSLNSEMSGGTFSD